MFEDIVERERNNARKMTNWWHVLVQSEPMDFPAADEAHDKKVLDSADFYYKMAAEIIELLIYEAKECQRVGLQYASVNCVYNACMNELNNLRDYITDFIEEQQNDQK